jgi:S1-C subfamily serine protease
MLAGDCDGVAVSRERATEIQAENVDRRRRALQSPMQPVIEGRQLNGIGTGFFVAADGTLLTNNHVVEGCSDVSVATPDGREAAGTVLDRRAQSDLALVKAPLEPDATAVFLEQFDLQGSTPLKIAGYPDQGLPPIKPLLTSGRLGPVSSRHDELPHFQISADVRHGNSGSPVVDGRALVVGVVFAKVNTVGVYQATGQKIRFVGVVVDNRAIFELLDANRIDYRKAASAPHVGAAELDARLRSIVARVGCWG